MSINPTAAFARLDEEPPDDFIDAEFFEVPNQEQLLEKSAKSGSSPEEGKAPNLKDYNRAAGEKGCGTYERNMHLHAAAKAGQEHPEWGDRGMNTNEIA